MRSALACGAVVALAVTAVVGQSLPAGVTRTVLLDNHAVTVARLRFDPGAREEPHTHPFPLLSVQLTPGDTRVLLGETSTATRARLGEIRFFAADARHAAANVGAEAWEVIAVALKPTRIAGGQTAPAQTATGITRTVLLDNADLTAATLEIAADGREIVHTHPYDVVVLPLTTGRVELQLGERKSITTYRPGEPIFIARDVPHAAVNVGAPLSVLAVSIK